MGTLDSLNSQKDIFNRLDRSGGGNFALRMAPLIDIIFLLLIFFLVTANWRPKEGFLPFELPSLGSDSAVSIKAEPLVIEIGAVEGGCEVRIGAGEVIEIGDGDVDEGLALMMGELKRCMVEQKRFVCDPVEIVCGDEVEWEFLAKIYNLIYGAGIEDITFAMTE